MMVPSWPTAVPLLASGGPENYAFASNPANHRSSVDVGKVNSKQPTGCAADLRDPTLAAVRCSQNCSVEETNNCPVILVSEVDPVKPVRGIAGLLSPVASSICCP